MKRQIENLKKDDLRPGDQALVVFDQDNWGQDLIELVWDWSKGPLNNVLRIRSHSGGFQLSQVWGQ